MSNPVSTTLRIVDQMTAPIMSIDNAINNLINGFNSVENAADIDTSTFDEMKRQVEMTGFAAEQLNQTFQVVNDGINQAANSQQNFNNHLRTGGGLADNLGGRVRGLVAAAGGLLTIRAANSFIQESIGFANEQIRAEQLLANVLSNQGASQEEFNALKQEAANISNATMFTDQAMIGGAAELSTYISDVEALQVMMGTLADYASGMAGGSEVGYTQMIDYATQLGKALEGQYDGLAKKGFVLTDVQRDIIQNGTEMERALVLQDVIAQSWEGLAEQMAQTPEGMRVSMMNSINEIREGFGTQLLPVVMMLFQTIQGHLPQIQQMLAGLIPVIQWIIELIGNIIGVAFAVYQFFADNWSMISPIIYGIAAAFVAWKIATIAVTIAQSALNAVMMANPLGIIIAAIAAIIGKIVMWVQKMGGLRIAWMVVVNVVMTYWDLLKLAFFTGVYFVLDMWDRLTLGFQTAGVAIANFMGDMKANVLMILQNMVNGAINIINGFISTLNAIPGVNIGLINQVTFGTEAQLANEAERQARESGLANARAEVDAAIAGRADALNTMRRDLLSDFAARNAEIEAARAENVADDSAPVSASDFVISNLDGVTSGVGEIADNTAAIAGNTRNMTDFTEENLKLWRDIAERDVVNRFTTAEVNVNFGDVNNNVSDNMDLDGIVDYIAESLEETLHSVARGVHA